MEDIEKPTTFTRCTNYNGKCAGVVAISQDRVIVLRTSAEGTSAVFSCVVCGMLYWSSGIQVKLGHGTNPAQITPYTVAPS